MNHAITFGDLLIGAALLAGLAMLVVGVLAYLAGGMAPIPDEKLGNKGCLCAIVGIALVAAGIWGGVFA